MHEQRPPTSPGVHPAAGQPPRPAPPLPQQHATHHAHPVNVPHPQSHHAPAAPRSAHAATASLPVEEDLVILEDVMSLEDDAPAPAPLPVPVPAAPVTHAAPAAPAAKKITFNTDSMTRHRNYKRQTHTTGLGACRVKTFHGKLSDQGLEYLDDAINVFLDEHPDIEVKLVQSNVGMFDGKFKDFALVVNVWY
jgi:hypothetical protein